MKIRCRDAEMTNIKHNYLKCCSSRSWYWYKCKILGVVNIGKRCSSSRLWYWYKYKIQDCGGPKGDRLSSYII